MGAIEQLAAQGFKWGNLQVLRYDPRRPEFQHNGPSYLAYLYERSRTSGRSRLGIIPSLLCGFRDLSCEAVIQALGQSPLIVMGEWREWEEPAPDGSRVPTVTPYFHALGFAFPAGPITVAPNSTQSRPLNSMFGAYAFFEDAWRTPQQTVLMYLGLAYLFHAFSLVNLHGMRYPDNKLTARWCGKFGFRDLGTIPNYMVREGSGELADGVISTLDRAELEQRLSVVLGGATSPE